MKPVLSDPQVRTLRMRAQRLLDSVLTAPIDVLKAVCGVQSQDLPSGALSLRPRGSGLTAIHVDQVREARAIAWVWCMRGTLHLVTAEDARRLIPFYGPDLIAGDRRRFEQLGWDASRASRGIELLRDALAERGALTRSEIRDLLKANRLPNEGQAPVHLIYRAALEGLLCYGPRRGGEIALTNFDGWLGRPEPHPRSETLAWLAQRYLEAYAPAAPEDFASWSGLKLSEARQAWNAISGQTVEVDVRGKPAWLLDAQLPWLGEVAAPLVRLLPRYDTYWLGYANRDLSVPTLYAKRVHPGGGQISAVLLVDGQAVGTWTTRRQNGVLQVRVEPFERLPGAVLEGLQGEVDDLGRFLGEKTAVSFGMSK